MIYFIEPLNQSGSFFYLQYHSHPMSFPEWIPIFDYVSHSQLSASSTRGVFDITCKLSMGTADTGPSLWWCSLSSQRISAHLSQIRYGLSLVGHSRFSRTLVTMASLPSLLLFTMSPTLMSFTTTSPSTTHLLRTKISRAVRNRP